MQTTQDGGSGNLMDTRHTNRNTQNQFKLDCHQMPASGGHCERTLLSRAPQKGLDRSRPYRGEFRQKGCLHSAQQTTQGYTNGFLGRDGANCSTLQRMGMGEAGVRRCKYP